MKYINNSDWSNKYRTKLAVMVLFAILLSISVPSYAEGHGATQSSSQFGYPFSVINSTMTEGVNGNSYQLQIGMDDAEVTSLAQFNLNLSYPFYGPGNNISEQVSKTNIQVSYFELSFPIYVEGNPKSGNYTFLLYIQYWQFFPYGYSHYSNEQTLNVTLSFLGTTVIGITTSSNHVVAGETNNLLFSLQNKGTGSVTDLNTGVSPQSQFTFINSFPKIPALVSGVAYNFTESMFVSSGTSGVIPLNLTTTFDNPYGSQSSESNQVSLYVQPLVASINITPSTDSLSSGKTNYVSFNIENNGNGNLTNVQIDPSSQSQLSFLKQFSVINSLGMGESYTMIEPIYVSTSVSGAVTVDFSLTFTTPSGSTSSEQSSVGFYTQQASTSENVSLQVKFVSQYVVLGLNSSAVLEVSNIGNSTVSSPVISVSAPSGFTIVGNSTFYYPSVKLLSGNAITIPIILSSSPTTSQGSYVITAAIDYYNSSGDVISHTFSAGFLALASVSIVLQAFSENNYGGTITVNGTLLDEGAGSAYYLTLTATFAQQNSVSNGTTYLGDIDSNTPTPFSLTFNLPQGVRNGTSTISIQVSYQNYYGATVNSTIFTHSIVYKNSSGQTNINTPPKNYGSFRGVGILVITTILVIVVVAGLVLVRRRRNVQRGKQQK
jgi:hypothetical protein